MTSGTKGPQSIDDLIRIRPKLSSQAEREVRCDSRLRQARTCYGHLAGVAGVALMDRMISLGWLEEDLSPGPGNRVQRVLARGSGPSVIYPGNSEMDAC